MRRRNKKDHLGVLRISAHCSDDCFGIRPFLFGCCRRKIDRIPFERCFARDVNFFACRFASDALQLGENTIFHNLVPQHGIFNEKPSVERRLIRFFELEIKFFDKHIRSGIFDLHAKICNVSREYTFEVISCPTLTRYQILVFKIFAQRLDRKSVV